MKHIKTTIKEYLGESIKQDKLDEILDKISEFGIDSLSNHEKTILRSFSNNSIDIKNEIEKHQNKFKTTKQVIETIPLKQFH